jgi:hypothetical protein
MVPAIRKWLIGSQSTLTRIRQWCIHPNRVRDAGLLTIAMAVVSLFLHAVLLAHALLVPLNLSPLPTTPMPEHFLLAGLIYVTCYDIPFLWLGFLILRKNIVAICVAILLGLSILGLAVIFISAPEVFPLGIHVNRAHTKTNWLFIACIVAPQVGLNVLALLACWSSRRVARSQVG